MLDRASKKFIKFIVKEKPNMDDGLFTSDYVAENLELTESETRDCLCFLESKGLVRCVYVDNDALGFKHALWGFAPTHNGRHHVEFAALELCDTVLKSILLPIIVSIITALLIA